MSNPPDHPLSESPAHSTDPAEALEHVVDDLQPVSESADWVRDQLLAGATPEQLTSHLIGAGWNADDAEALVEQVRKLTRRERGVLTREDVMGQVNRRYRKSMSGGWFVGMPTLGAAMRLIYAMANFMSLNRLRRRHDDDEVKSGQPPRKR